MRNLILALAAVPLMAGAVWAQSFPDRPVTLVVGFSPGGGMDTLGRMVAERVSQELGQQMIVENRPGAGGTIAPGYVAAAAADGYILWLGETGALTGPVAQQDVGYDPVESFEPIAQLAVAPMALVANKDQAVASISEFVDLVKGAPGEFFYAAPGVGTVQHLAVELMKAQAGLDIEPVQFQGGSPSVAAVVSGEVPFAIVSLNAAASQAEGGAVKILGVTTPEPVPGFEDLPTIASVVPGFDGSARQFVMAPKGTPPEVIERLEAAFAAAMADADLQAALSGRGLLPTYLDADALGSQLPGVVKIWSETAASVLAN